MSLLPSGPVSLDRAREIQDRLRSRIVREGGFQGLRYIAGLDVGYCKKIPNTVQAAGVILDRHGLRVVDQIVVRDKVLFPYIPGFLSFREAPVLYRVVKRFALSPDLILCDGQGLAHPRRFGLASHLGLLLDLPSIGVAKSRLLGQHSLPGPKKGDWSPLVDKGETIGAVVRTRSRVKPVYVSTGHRVGLETAVDLVLSLCPRYRIPEPIRLADQLSSG
ncbi:MAG: deoxyribonuclease V [Desulfohalobiaceae bacterium]|nr:deoxyribonuclease V [Desulfohalobiaceae bacterium]